MTLPWLHSISHYDALQKSLRHYHGTRQSDIMAMSFYRSSWHYLGALQEDVNMTLPWHPFISQYDIMEMPFTNSIWILVPFNKSVRHYFCCVQYHRPLCVNFTSSWRDQTYLYVFFSLFDLILYVQVNNFLVRDGSSWFEPVLSRG